MHKVRSSSNRIIDLDVAKGIGVILVIIGHNLNTAIATQETLHQIIYSFHMPLFAIISGFLLNLKTELTLSLRLLKRLTVRLVIPYLTWHTAYPLLHDSHDKLSPISRFLSNALLSPNAPWYLLGIFYAIIFAAFLNSTISDKSKLLPVLTSAFLFAFISAITSAYIPYRSLLLITTEYSTYILLGKYIVTSSLNTSNMQHKIIGIGVVFALVLIFNYLIVSSPIIDLLNSMLGAFIVLTLVKTTGLPQLKSLLAILGRFSLEYYVVSAAIIVPITINSWPAAFLDMIYQFIVATLVIAMVAYAAKKWQKLQNIYLLLFGRKI